MKYLITIIFTVFLFGLHGQETSGNQSFLKIVSSNYRSLTADLIEFGRIVQDSGTFYLTEGTIVFDNDGNTIQTITKNKVIDEKDVEKTLAALKSENYKPAPGNFPKVFFIQLQPKKGDSVNVLDLRLQISDKIDRKLMTNNLGTSYGADKGDGVANIEIEVNDWDRALPLIIETLINEDVLNNCVIGKRVYFEEDDYNYELIYPIDFNGSIYPY